MSVSFISMERNKADPQGQLYFDQSCFLRIKLTLRVRCILASRNRRTMRVSFMFMERNKADAQGQLYFDQSYFLRIKLTLRVRFILAQRNRADDEGQLYFH